MNKIEDVKSFWYLDKDNSWPPDSITHLEDYKPTDKLALFITQTSLKPSLQNKLIDNWCKKLNELDNVRYLWFTSRVNQKMFEAACDTPNLEGLWINGVE